MNETLVVNKDLRVVGQKLMYDILADEAKNHNWTYYAVRPMPIPASPYVPGRSIVGDCSKGVQYINHWAGVLNDPMGMGWGPNGNSQTLWTNLQHLDHASQLQVMDIVTFGHNGEEHAASVLEAGLDPLLWSFGHQGAPNSYRLSQDKREKQFLLNPIAVYVPTPQDVLRAKTTWFAWVAWKLGEGDFRHYGPEDKTVRPNVPKKVPAGWWVRYAQFLANRKKANKPTLVIV